MRHFVGVALLLGAFGFVACSSSADSQTGAPKLQLGDRCQFDGPDDCASHFCDGDIQGYITICSKNCTSDADCSGTLPVCGADYSGRHVCVFGCPSSYHPGFTCDTGGPAAVACGTLGGVCTDCGCPSIYQRCEAGVGCTSSLGKSCTTGDDCPNGVCITPAGRTTGTCRAACDDSPNKNCEYICRITSNGIYYCPLITDF